MANLDIFEIVKKDSSLKNILSTLTKEEIDDNILELFKQHLANEKCKNCQGKKECEFDPKYLKQSLVNDKGVLTPVLSECEFKKNDFHALYMPPLDLSQELYVNEKRAVLFKEINNAKNGGKGIYLCGSFGCGKTYLMMKLAKELSKEKEVLFVYYPELINRIKNAVYKNDNTYEYTIDMMKNVDCLFLDDIGREQNTQYNRDQILGTILQYRYMNNKQTFMTSNYDVQMLREHLSNTKNGIDSINSDGIIERILAMMNVVKLEDKNYR